MKKEIIIIGVTIISLFFFASCGTWRINKTSDFAKLNSLGDIEGTYYGRAESANYERYRKHKEYSYYLNNQENATRLFDISNNADFITISFENSNKLKLSFYNDTISQTAYFEGKFNGKFFEIYLQKKQFFIPLIYSNVNINRLRIGKSKKGELLVQNFYDQSGNLLLFAGGYGGENTYKFYHKNIFKDHTPTIENEKWGYIDSLNKTIIPCIYDYTSVFEGDVARVKKDDKWGLINKQGQEVTPFCYDYISPIDTLRISLFQVKIGDKWGIINPNGQDIIPPIFDIIDHHVTSDNIVGITFDKKQGYASLEKGVIIPAIYDKISNHTQGLNRGMRNGKMYQINKEEDGYYEYELKEVRYGLLKNIARIDVRYDPIPETRRKLDYNDQFSQEYEIVTI